VKFRDSVFQSKNLRQTVPDSNSSPEPEQQQEGSESEASDVFHETEEGLEGVQSLSGLIIVDQPITLIFVIDEPTPPSDPYAAQSSSYIPPASTYPPSSQFLPFIPPPSTTFTSPTPTVPPPPLTPTPAISTTTATAPPATSGIKFNPPTVFDGSYKEFRKFLCEIELFLNGYKITENDAKIITALSYMRGQHVDEFVQKYVDDATSNNPPVWGTWNDFKNRLRDRFQNKNFSQESREKLEYFQQGKMNIDEFFTKLEILFTDGGVTTDNEKIRILEKSLDDKIIDTIYTSDNAIPDTYNAYKNKALQLGHMRERHRALHRVQVGSSSSSTSLSTKPPTKAAHTFHMHIHPPTRSNIPTSGPGPMDVDKTRQQMVCFNCGGLGHMRRDCPKEKAKMNIRALMESLEDEELQELKAELSVEEMDFTDGR
jgi:hypothetical protein